MEHNQKCLEFQKQCADRNSAYKEKWPNFCKTCGGAGEFHFTENGAPLGEGYWPMPMADPCEACTNQGICPRCGKEGLTNEEKGDTSTGDGPCKFCSWDYKDGGMPEEFDGFCSCYQDEIDKLEFEEGLI